MFSSNYVSPQLQEFIDGVDDDIDLVDLPKNDVFSMGIVFLYV